MGEGRHQDAYLAEDAAEMASIFARCKSPLLRHELDLRVRFLQELASSAKELRLDADEMRTLSSVCKSAKVRRELMAWMDQASARSDRMIQWPTVTGGLDTAFGVAQRENLCVDDVRLEHGEIEALALKYRNEGLGEKLTPQRKERIRSTVRTSCAKADVSVVESVDDVPPPVESVDDVPPPVTVAAPVSALVPTDAASSLVTMDAPILVIIGVEGGPTKELLQALTNGGPLRFRKGATMTAEIEVRTKYFVAFPQCSVVELSGSLRRSFDEDAMELARNAEGIIFLWDASRSDTLDALKQFYAMTFAGDDAVERDSLRLCVAVKEGPVGVSLCSDLEKDAMSWCLDNRFEHLCCSLSSVDLEELQTFFHDRTARGLTNDIDDTAVRIADALLNHTWPSLPLPESSATPFTKSAPDATDDLPIVVFAGFPGVGQRLLFEAVTDASGRETPGADLAAQARLDTKYYTATVLCCVIDIPEGGVASKAEHLLNTAEALILLFDPARPETLRCMQELQARLQAQERCYEVQLCIAVDAKVDGRDDVIGIETWCGEHGFEYLRCPLGEKDIEDLRDRWRSGAVSAVDTDNTASRIADVLESHTWPGLDLKTGAMITNIDHPRQYDGYEALVDPESSTSSDPPLVVFAGARGLGKRGLVRAINGNTICAGGEADMNTLCTLRTKYYSARLQIRVVDLDGDSELIAESLKAATAVVIFWSTTQPDTFQRASTLYDSEVEKGTGYSLRLCVAVGAEDTLGAAGAQSWCIERGFEMLHCSLDEQGLIGVTERWRDSAGKGASLLASDSRGAVCIVEAMECCCWPGAEESSVACAGKPAAAHSSTLAEQTTSDSEKAERTTGSTAKPNVEAVCDAEGADEKSLDMLEHMMGEVRSVRSIEDRDQRLQRAEVVAMQLAQALGVDSDDDED